MSGKGIAAFVDGFIGGRDKRRQWKREDEDQVWTGKVRGREETEWGQSDEDRGRRHKREDVAEGRDTTRWGWEQDKYGDYRKDRGRRIDWEDYEQSRVKQRDGREDDERQRYADAYAAASRSLAAEIAEAEAHNAALRQEAEQRRADAPASGPRSVSAISALDPDAPAPSSPGLSFGREQGRADWGASQGVRNIISQSLDAQAPDAPASGPRSVSAISALDPDAPAARGRGLAYGDRMPEPPETPIAGPWTELGRTDNGGIVYRNEAGQVLYRDEQGVVDDYQEVGKIMRGRGFVPTARGERQTVGAVTPPSRVDAQGASVNAISALDRSAPAPSSPGLSFGREQGRADWGASQGVRNIISQSLDAQAPDAPAPSSPGLSFGQKKPAAAQPSPQGRRIVAADPAQFDKQATRAARSFMDHYRETAAPQIMEGFLKAGEPAKAEAFGKFIESGQTQEAMTHWSKAIFSAQTGNARAFAENLAKAYNTRGYFDDGINALIDKSAIEEDPETGEIYGHITFANTETGEEVQMPFRGLDDLYRSGVGMLAPQEVFKRNLEQTDKADERRAQLLDTYSKEAGNNADKTEFEKVTKVMETLAKSTEGLSMTPDEQMAAAIAYVRQFDDKGRYIGKAEAEPEAKGNAAPQDDLPIFMR